MKNIDQKIDVIADFCSKRLKKNDRVFAKAIGELLGSMYTDEQNKEKNIEDFIKILKNKQVNEGVGDMLKGMTAGALLAMCLINPAYSKTIVDNIQTHHPVTAKYESGDKGYDCIVKDNYGGYSYGKDQISTERRNGNPSTFDYFMKYAKEKDPNIEYHLRKAGGWEAANKGDPAFIAKWCEMTFRKDFQDVYNGFMRDKEFLPVYQRMDKTSHGKFDKVTTWASNNKAVQASINSAIIQHGKNGAYKLMNKVVTTKNIKTPEQFVKALYDLRAAKYPKYKSRYKAEYADVSKYLKNKEARI